MSDNKQLMLDIALAEKQLYALDQWAAEFAPQRTGQHSIPEETLFQLLQAKRRMANLKAAASVPVALALYGASQAGKSLFVGNLVRGLDGKTALGIRPGDTPPELDFQRHLNPANGLEATAVVTRFSFGERIDPPAELAHVRVRARLFSRCDLMKALGRGFYSECKSEIIWTDQKLEQEIACLTSKKAKHNMSLRADMVEAYRFLKHEMRQHNFQADAAALNRMLTQHVLTEAGYIELASKVFWEDWPAICGLFKELLDLRVNRLKESQEYLYLPWEAVRFLLDSSRPEEALIEPLNPKEPFRWTKFKLSCEKEASIAYNGRTGASVDLALLQGIVAELQIPLVGDSLSPISRRLFSCADCLDIPGAISALGHGAPTQAEFKLMVERGEHPELVVMKRGRVGLLFEKYAVEMQANVVLYLPRSGNLDARGELPPQINLWGRSSFKERWPGKLHKEEKRLLVGLTRIDELLKLDVGKEKFDELLGTQLAGHFSDWMNNYGGAGVPFNDVFLIRYPGIIDSLKADVDPKHKRWEQAYLSSELVKKHINDPLARWNAAFQDDGGIAPLMDQIIPRLNNQYRWTTLAGEVSSLLDTSTALVRQFWVDPSIHAEMNRRKTLAQEIVTWLEADDYGYRSAFLAKYFHCPTDIIHGALKKERPPDDLPIPHSIQFRRVVQNILNDWVAGLTPLDVEKLLPAKERISGQTIVKFASYVCEYLNRRCLDDMAGLLKGVHLGAAPAEYQSWVVRYSVMVIDDYLMTPGPRNQSVRQRVDLDAPYQAMTVRYKSILADRLAEGVAGAGAQIPAGNSELGVLIGAQVEGN